METSEKHDLAVNSFLNLWTDLNLGLSAVSGLRLVSGVELELRSEDREGGSELIQPVIKQCHADCGKMAV